MSVKNVEKYIVLIRNNPNPHLKNRLYTLILLKTYMDSCVQPKVHEYSVPSAISLNLFRVPCSTRHVYCISIFPHFRVYVHCTTLAQWNRRYELYQENSLADVIVHFFFFSKTPSSNFPLKTSSKAALLLYEHEQSFNHELRNTAWKSLLSLSLTLFNFFENVD